MTSVAIRVIVRLLRLIEEKDGGNDLTAAWLDLPMDERRLLTAAFREYRAAMLERAKENHK